MSATYGDSDLRNSSDEPKSEIFTARIFNVSIAGVCAVIVLMIVAGDWW